MYGLKELAILAYEQHRKQLARYGYVPFKHTWHVAPQHFPHYIITVAVDEFGIKYFKNYDANHLFSALQDKYSIKFDWY